jgi:hypothetical protein
MKSLIILCLEHNNLSSFGKDTLKASTSLSKIVLRSNQLTFLDKDTFSHASETLRVIDLSHNNLDVNESFLDSFINRFSLLTFLRTSSTITKELGTVDGSPLGDARLSDLYVPCRADGFSGSGDGFWHQLQTCTCPGGCI